MKIRFIDWDFKEDDNEGYIYGIEEDVSFPEYIEWFKTLKERAEYVIQEGFEVVDWIKIYGVWLKAKSQRAIFFLLKNGF